MQFSRLLSLDSRKKLIKKVMCRFFFLLVDEVKAITDHKDCWPEIKLKRVLLIGVMVVLDVRQKVIIG